jgi:hypothetical protein
MRSAIPPVKTPGLFHARQGQPWLVVLSLALASTGLAQTPAGAPSPSAGTAALPAAAPVRLDLSRRDLKNFLSDKDALSPYQQGDAAISELRDVFTLGSVEARYAVFWDPLACRLVGILDLEAPPEPAPAVTEATPPGDAKPEASKESGGSSGNAPAPSPYLFKAEGPFPLVKTAGASGVPRFFGFRLVKDVPEFLYTCGGLSIEERLWLDQGGQVLKQRFSVKQGTRGLQIAVPEAWKGRIEASAGTWKGAVLSVPQEASGEVILTYPLVPAATPPASAPKAL